MLDVYERQVFAGPPENTREHVLVAGRLLLLGEWRKAKAALFGIEAWRLVGDQVAKDKMQAQLDPQLREAALRTYVLSALPHYKALSLATLAPMFEVSEASAHATVSRMIGSQELSAAWDQLTQALVPHAHATSEPSALQALALHFADRANALLDASEQQSQSQDGEQQQGGQQRQQRQGQRQGDGQRRYANAPRSDRRFNKGQGGQGQGAQGQGGQRNNNEQRNEQRGNGGEQNSRPARR